MKQSNWDDDFDFDDDVPKKKTITEKKKVVKDNDFFDDDQNTNKLPSIGSKNTISKQLPNNNKRSSARQNPYAQNMKLRGNVYDDDDNVYEDIDDIPKNKVTINNNNNNNNNNSNKKKQVQQDMDYYQQIDDSPKKQVKQQIKQQIKKPVANVQNALKKMLEKQQSQQQYNQDIADDGYGDDFQQVVEQPKVQQKKNPPATDPQNKKSIINTNKIQPIKQNQNNLNVNVVNQNQKKINGPPKPPSRASQSSKPQPPPYRNMTVEKNLKPNLPRSQSRQSLKSAQSKNRSRVVSNKFTTNTSFVPNKFSNQIDKSFPEVNLNQMNQDKLNKLNEKLRAMIKKFNQQLNQLINKNMLYLKSKKTQKSVNVQTKLKILEEQSKNNQTMIDVMQKQYDKLAGRDGELRQQQYQLMTQKRIQQMKQQIKQAQKTIVKLKTQIKSQGNKLTNKNQDKKLAAEVHHLKTTLIQSKKDQQKQNQKIQKLDQQMQDLGTKISDIDYKLSDLFDQAKDKGIQLQSKQEIIKKYDTIKKKVQASRNHRAKLQNLLKTKSDIISHEKQQMKINIKNCELQIKNLYDSISHVHHQSIKVVQKARTNPKLTSNLVSDLDAILKSLELVQSDNYSVRSQQNNSQHSQRPLKNNIVVGNMEKSQPHKRSQSANNDKHANGLAASQDPSKPNLLKKKGKVNQMPEQKKNDYQRIWRDEQKQKLQKPKKQQIKLTQPLKLKQKQPQKPVEQQKDKKKPFSIKKNRLNGDNKTTQKSQMEQQKNQPLKLQNQIQKKVEQQKKQQVSLAGPKMIKFKKKGNQQMSKQMSKQIKQQQKPKLILQNKPQQEIKNEEQKPSFVPKRFTLRKQQQKKQDSYIPSIQTKQKEQVKKQQPKKQITIQKKPDQYKPKFNFGDVQDNFKMPAYDPFEKKPQNQVEKPIAPVLQEKKEEDQKPKFNLRLRDRKKNNQDGGYMPTTVAQNKTIQQKPVVQQKQIIIDKPKINPPSQQQTQNNTNPYAPKQNTINIAGNKQNANIVKQQPKFNLSKDTSNQNLPKQSTINNKPQQQLIPNNPNNPYTQNQGPTRQKQGPVKKPKIQQPGQKQKFNIYEQAQQAQGLNQFVNEPKIQKKQANNNFNPIATKDLNLNDLLGVKAKKNDDDLADLIGGGNATKKAKKNNDFFADLDL